MCVTASKAEVDSGSESQTKEYDGKPLWIFPKIYFPTFELIFNVFLLFLSVVSVQDALLGKNNKLQNGKFSY